MFILQCFMSALCGYALTRFDILPCHWEWWVIVSTMVMYTFFGFHLGRSSVKDKEENNNENH